MHKTAYETGRLFIEKYCQQRICKVLDVGAMNVNGTLRDFKREGMEYIGVDIESGDGVDVVLDDPYSIPFDNDVFDAVVSTSTFEHASHFWLLFVECLRVTKCNGFFYISAPSNGSFHQFPHDFWRFYPDSGLALVDWARRCGTSASLIESGIAAQDTDIWNDYFAVFQKAPVPLGVPEALIVDTLKGCTNIRRFNHSDVLNHRAPTEDEVRLHESALQIRALHTELDIASCGLKHVRREPLKNFSRFLRCWSSQAVLRFEPVLAKSFAERMRRRVAKNACSPSTGTAENT